MENAKKFFQRFVLCTAFCGVIKFIYPVILNALSQPEIPTVNDGLYTLTENSFNHHIQSGQHFVKFYAPWCQHCKNLVPVWNDLAKTFEDDLKVRISELDCTQAQNICQEQKVKGYPSLYYYHNGVQVQSYNGARTKNDMEHFIQSMKSTLSNRKSEYQSTENVKAEL